MSDEPFGPFPKAMLDNAEWQLEQSQYGAAILLAQAAVEMATHHAFIALLGRRFGTPVEDRVLELVPDRSFMNRRTRTFWQLLTGKAITRPRDVWQAYRVHVERRNQVAHGSWGDAPGQEDPEPGGGARESVAAVRAFMERMAADL